VSISPSASISVVVPCYNAERWIVAALESVLAQDWPVREVIVVDDGSSDGSAQLVRSRFPHVTLLQQPNRGVAAARNQGIERAQGEWIAFIDADDIWLPGKLKAQWEALAAEPGTRLAYTAWHVWKSDEPYPTQDLLDELCAEAGVPQRWAGPSGWIYPELLLDCCVWSSTVLAHRSLFAEIGVFDPGLRIGEDYDLWLRASRVTPILRVAQPLALYRMHPKSITKAAPDTNYRALVVSRAVARWGCTSPDGSCANKADVDRTLARTWCDFAGAHLVAGNLERSRYGALMSLRVRWQHLDGWKLLAKNMVRSLAGGVGRP
jgi:glycosyltransferase involved in cell wall biosynthesis